MAATAVEAWDEVCPAQCALAELRAIRGVLEAAVRYALDL
jgi:hypothetical protein